MSNELASTWAGRLQVKGRGRMQLALSTIMARLGRSRFDRAAFALTHHQVAVPGLPPAFQGFRIAHISDIHMGHWINAERLAGVVELVNEQQPDLVAITGDFVSYVFDEIAGDMIDSLRRLASTDGVMAVLGNHDHWLGAPAVRGLLAAANVHDLSNDVATIGRGPDRLHIAGVDDIIAGADHLPGVLAKLPPTGPAVLLAHEPDFAITSAATGRFHLQLSGHSHGAQIVLPRIGPIIRGPHFRHYPIGRYQVGQMTLYTSRGIGTHMLRLRVNCPPEIALFELFAE
jgi:predicted MPP superfamily phosphohydrolase